MPKLKDFLTALAKKAGMDTEGATVKDFFSALPETEVPEDVQKGIDNSLISLTDAKNNHPEIKNYYQKQSLDGVDKVLNDLLSEYELDETDKQEVINTRSTYQRVPLLTKKIADLITKKHAADPKDKKAIQQEIDNLHTAIKAEKEGRAADKKEFERIRKDEKINGKKNILYSGAKTIHDDLDPDVRFNIIDSIIKKELQDNQAQFELGENGDTVLLKLDGTNYYGENHQQITPAKFIEQTLAKNKQLKVSSPNGSNGANTSQNRAYQPPVNGNGQADKNPNAAVIDLNKQALRDIEAAAANNR